MTKIIIDLKKQQVLERPKSPSPSFLSKMFIIPKNDGSFRPVFDLRGLNRYVHTKHFQLISHASIPEFLQNGDWMVKIDISNAYFHIPIAESHRCYLRMIYNNELLQMNSLPFGLASAPRTFAAVTNWIAEILRDKEIRVLVYLDDFLLVHQDQAKLVSQTAEVVRLLESMGWQINYLKSVLKPMQQLEYLGITWNTKTDTMYLSERKIKNIKTAITKLLSKKACNLKQVQKILGQLNFASFVIRRGRLHCRYIQILLNRFKQNLKNKRVLPPQVRQDLRWWSQSLVGKAVLHQRPYTHFLTTDAADTGWGAQLNEKMMSGVWTKDQMKWHSNWKELFAVYASIQKQSHCLQNAHILVQSDNRTLVAYIRNDGGTHSMSLLNLTCKLLRLTDRKNILLSAHYLPGRYNCTADHLSRGRRLSEWHLLPAVTNQLFHRWGIPDVDLFASAETAVVSRYVSLDWKDNLAIFPNAFSQDWNFRLGWIFPPPSLIPRVLAQLNRAKGHYILIAPLWEKTFWLADLKNRALEPPVTIEKISENLVDTATGLPPPQADQLNLQAWLVGGGQNQLVDGQNQKNNY
ncbi:unnamed protein product [Parnassius mnemosyne]|uniref:Reverse transcriptase domain-containing protein n=1 Tax=Parnassius mnemosyne TaxID=213953 RepID=A0AAV1KRA3_9NEOP